MSEEEQCRPLKNVRPAFRIVLLYLVREIYAHRKIALLCFVQRNFLAPRHCACLLFGCRMSRSASSSVTCNLQQTFQHKLQKDWKRRTACGRFYVDTNSLVAWMNESETDNNLSNAGRLLIEVYPRNSPRGRTLVSPSTKDISSVEDRALLVFGILLELGHGDLIDLFQRSKIIDKDLSTSQVYRNQLQYELASNGVPDPIGIIDKFERAKWSFCPAIIRNGKSERFINGTILPYSKRDRVNEKGGTAEVWQVLLQEDVMKQDLKEAIKGSRFKHKEFGWVGDSFHDSRSVVKCW